MTFVIVTSSARECELHSMCAPARALSRIVLCLTKMNDLDMLYNCGMIFYIIIFRWLYPIIRPTRHAGHCWRSRDELISDVLLWTPSHGRVKAGRPARTYIEHLCEDTECSPEDQPEAINDREGWQERVSDICADGTTR